MQLIVIIVNCSFLKENYFLRNQFQVKHRFIHGLSQYFNKICIHSIFSFKKFNLQLYWYWIQYYNTRSDYHNTIIFFIRNIIWITKLLLGLCLSYYPLSTLYVYRIRAQLQRGCWHRVIVGIRHIIRHGIAGTQGIPTPRCDLAQQRPHRFPDLAWRAKRKHASQVHVSQQTQATVNPLFQLNDVHRFRLDRM